MAQHLAGILLLAIGLVMIALGIASCSAPPPKDGKPQPAPIGTLVTCVGVGLLFWWAAFAFAF